jgi:hypothetical protein
MRNGLLLLMQVFLDPYPTFLKKTTTVDNPTGRGYARISSLARILLLPFGTYGNARCHDDDRGTDATRSSGKDALLFGRKIINTGPSCRVVLTNLLPFIPLQGHQSYRRVLDAQNYITNRLVIMDQHQYNGTC